MHYMPAPEPLAESARCNPPCGGVRARSTGRRTKQAGLYLKAKAGGGRRGLGRALRSQARAASGRRVHGGGRAWSAPADARDGEATTSQRPPARHPRHLAPVRHPTLPSRAVTRGNAAAAVRGARGARGAALERRRAGPPCRAASRVGASGPSDNALALFDRDCKKGPGIQLRRAGHEPLLPAIFPDSLESVGWWQHRGGLRFHGRSAAGRAGTLIRRRRPAHCQIRAQFPELRRGARPLRSDGGTGLGYASACPRAADATPPGRRRAVAGLSKRRNPNRGAPMPANPPRSDRSGNDTATDVFQATRPRAAPLPATGYSVGSGMAIHRRARPRSSAHASKHSRARHPAGRAAPSGSPGTPPRPRAQRSQNAVESPSSTIGNAWP